MKKKVLIFTSKTGHMSIAQAAADTLDKSLYEVFISEPISDKSFKLYTPFYRYFPFLFKIPFKLGEQEKIMKATQMAAGKILEKSVKNEIKNKQPDLIISTNCLCNPSISHVLDYQKTPIPFINIIADPWTPSPWSFCFKADVNLVYDRTCFKLGQKNKIPKEKLMPCGWFVRQEFYQKYDRKRVLKKLNFSPDKTTLLVCAGSEGTSMILKIIPALLTVQKPVQVIVVCGNNDNLYKILSSLNKLIKVLPKSRVEKLNHIYRSLDLRLFKFLSNMAEAMSISDLIIGKAGPNLLFESVAMEKPFFAICHISGQEDGNLKLIKKKHLGFVEENPVKAIKLLNKIIQKPQILPGFQKPLEKTKKESQLAGQVLNEVANKLIDANR